VIVMDIAKARDLLTQALGQLEDEPIPSPSQVIQVRAGATLQTVIDAAPDHAVLELEPATYEGVVRLTKPILLRAATLPIGRATVTSATAVLVSNDETLQIVGPVVSVLGLGVRSTNPDAQLVDILPSATSTFLDQLTVLGDPVKGQRRGIRAEGHGMLITRTHVGEIWRVGLETQAVGCSNGCRNLTIDDCTLMGAAQAFMAGGADAASADAMPRGIRISNSTLSKDPAWYGKKAQIKNALELKAAADVLVQDCILEYAGIAEGQGGYVIVLTPRNQDGGAPWSRVENVVFERCHARFGGGAVAFLGQDDSHPSGPCRAVTFRDVFFDVIDPKAGPWKGDGRAVFFNNGTEDVTFERVTIQGGHLTAGMYLGGTPPKNLKAQLQLPKATYDIKIDGGGQGLAALQAYAPDAVIDLAGPAATGYPA
jgi:hypothetical protein